MSKWNVAVYLRLSSDDGDKEESNSITNQKELINFYLKKEKDFKIKDYYIDDGFTGTDFERPDFKRLLVDMKNGKINTIVVKDLSRLGRNYIEVGNYLEEIFPLYNIRFIAVNDNIDSYKDPKSINNVIVPFKNLMNDEYARDISNKVRSVLDTKKNKGEFIGSIAPYGYLRNPRDIHKFIIDKNASKIVKKIFRMILNGKSKDEVIDELNRLGILPPRLYQMQNKEYKFKVTEQMKKWDKRKIDTILNNKAYTGVLIQSKIRRISHKVHKIIRNTEDDYIVIDNHHEAIITKEEFEQVQNIIYKRDIRVNKENKYDIFAGHLKCNDCGNTLTIKKSKNYQYYYCTSFLKEKNCTNHAINKKKLEEIVLSVIKQQIDLIIDMDKQIDEIIKENEVNYDIEILNNRIEEIENNIEKYQKLKENIKNDLIYEYITREEYTEYEKEYNYLLKKYNSQKKITNEKIENISYKSNKNKEWINKFKDNKNIEKLNKKIIDEIVDNIFICKDGNVKITFKYKNEYFEAIDFIKNKKCDIIATDVCAS